MLYIENVKKKSPDAIFFSIATNVPVPLDEKQPLNIIG